MLAQPSSQKMGTEYERYQGVEKHSSGFKLLAAMGWKEGEGLVRCLFSFLLHFGYLAAASSLAHILYLLQGAKGQGRKEHIKVRRRQDSSGIGLVSMLRPVEQHTVSWTLKGCLWSNVILI